MIFIGKSISTGKLHVCYGPNATACSHSGPRRTTSCAVASNRTIVDADPSTFCRKCFGVAGIEKAKVEARATL